LNDTDFLLSFERAPRDGAHNRMESNVQHLSFRRGLCLVVACVALVAAAPARGGALASHQATYLQSSTPAPRAAGLPHLDYYGGRVISHVRLDLIVWGGWSYPASVPLTGKHSVSSFLGGIARSKYLDWLSEYATPTQTIGRGTLEGVYTIHPPRASDGAKVTSAQIASVLRSMIGSGRIPKPTTSRMYVIFFRSGQVISTSFGNSTSSFCAYHDTMTYGSSTAYFAVVPYELGSRGCKPASSSFDNVTTIVSHELVEGITDPGVGLNRVAWYDRTHGEIGDICAATSTPAAVTGGDGVRYVVQREWSNRSRSCIVTR
jgi:hypothetical protein